MWKTVPAIPTGFSRNQPPLLAVKAVCRSFEPAVGETDLPQAPGSGRNKLGVGGLDSVPSDPRLCNEHRQEDFGKSEKIRKIEKASSKPTPPQYCPYPSYPWGRYNLFRWNPPFRNQAELCPAAQPSLCYACRFPPKLSPFRPQFLWTTKLPRQKEVSEE